MLPPNSLLQNRYLIVRSIGQGGMGTVYLARDQRLGNTVALKETFFQDARMRRAFEREARLLAHLRHSALPKVIDHFEEDDGQFLVMEYIPGDDLECLLAQRGEPFPLEKVLGWADQLLDALEYLHTQQEQPVLHRDIKPANLKLTGRNQIILLDFGLAKGSIGQMTSVAGSRSVVGFTPNFAPLEQIQGTGTDPRSDLYSLGATLYYLLTGTIPPNALDRVTAIISRRPDPLIPADQIAETVPAAIAQVLLRAMEQNPADRPASAEAMRLALQDAANAFAPTRLREPTPTRPASDANEAAPVPREEATAPVGVTQPSDPRIFPSQGDAGSSSKPETISATLPISAASGRDTPPAMSTIVAPHVPYDSTSDRPAEVVERRSSTKWILVAGAVLVVIATAAFGIYQLVKGKAATTALKPKLITKLTSNGKAGAVVFSPDGKSIAYAQKDGEQMGSLWLKRLDSVGADLQLFPPTKGFDGSGIKFSPDGGSIFYLVYESQENGPGKTVLFRVPTSGGSSTRLAENLDWVLAISPDGKKIAFVRSNYPNGETFVVADVSGANEKVLLKSPDYGTFASLSWSADNKQIAYLMTENTKVPTPSPPASPAPEDPERGEISIAVINADGSGQRKIVTHSRSTTISQMAWMPDNKSFICMAGVPGSHNHKWKLIEVSFDKGKEEQFADQTWSDLQGFHLIKDGSAIVLSTYDRATRRAQWWRLSYPDGALQKIDLDQESYRLATVSAEGSKIIASQASYPGGIWVAQSKDVNNPVQIASGEFEGLSWAPDGQLIYSTKASGNWEIWSMNADGSNLRQLTNDPGIDSSPWVTADNRYIVFVSTRDGNSRIWRMNRDGGNPIQLTSTYTASAPACSPDSQWIVYAQGTADSNDRYLHKVSIDGGNPVKLSDKPVFGAPAVSPDGKSIIYGFGRPSSFGGYSLYTEIIAFENGASIKTLDGYIDDPEWTTDGRGVANSKRDSPSSQGNIWIQPIDGGPQKQLTNFPDVKGDEVAWWLSNFRWSRDGNRAAYVRSHELTDLVLIADFK